MPSNREIAEALINAWLPQPVTAKSAVELAHRLNLALDAADLRGFERARETAAQECDGWDFGKTLAAAIRAIPYAEADDLGGRCQAPD